MFIILTGHSVKHEVAGTQRLMRVMAGLQRRLHMRQHCVLPMLSKQVSLQKKLYLLFFERR